MQHCREILMFAYLWTFSIHVLWKHDGLIFCYIFSVSYVSRFYYTATTIVVMPAFCPAGMGSD